MIKGKLSLFIIFSIIVALTGATGTFIAINMSKANKISREKLEFIIEKKEKVYDGSPLELKSIELDEEYSLPNGYSYDFICNDTITNVGVIYPNPNIIIYDNYGKNVTSLYDCIIKDNGGLTVTQRAINVNFNSISKVYDGTPLNQTTFEIVEGSLAIGQKVSPEYKSEAKSIDDGKVDIKATVHVLDINGTDVSDNYYVTDNLSGENIPTFEITGNVLTIYTSDMEWEYDGKPHSYSKGFIYEGLRPGDEVIISESKSIVNVSDGGENYVDPDCVEIIDSDGVSVREKYGIIVKPIGKLTITPHVVKLTRSDEVVLGEYTYTGEPQSLEVTPERIAELGLLSTKDQELLGDYKLKCYSSADKVEVGRYNAELYIADDSNEESNNFILDNSYYGKIFFEIVDSIEEFKVEFELIDNKPVISKTYDGKEILATSIYRLTERSVAFLNKNELTCIYKFEKKICDAKTYSGSDLNLSVTFYDKNSIPDDKIEYKNPKSLSKIEIESKRLIFVTGSATKVYDGTPLKCLDYTYSGLPDGFTFEPMLSRFVVPTITEVFEGPKDNKIKFYYTIYLDEEDVTDNFDEEVVYGTLEITKATLYVFVNDKIIPTGDPIPSEFSYTISGNGVNISGLEIETYLNGNTINASVYVNGEEIDEDNDPNINLHIIPGNIIYV